MNKADKVLCTIMGMIVRYDEEKDYDKRNRVIYLALNRACVIGYSCGIRTDPREPEWPVAFIELPTGQVSWHLPQHVTPWDGHSTEEKYRRIDEYMAEVV